MNTLPLAYDENTANSHYASTLKREGKSHVLASPSPGSVRPLSSTSGKSVGSWVGRLLIYIDGRTILVRNKRKQVPSWLIFGSRARRTKAGSSAIASHGINYDLNILGGKV